MAFPTEYTTCLEKADRVSCQSWLTYINEDLAARSTMCKCGSALTYHASKVLFLDEGKVGMMGEGL